MRSRLAPLLVLALLLVVAPGSGWATSAPSDPSLYGQVTGEDSPLHAAWVYAFQVASSTYEKVATDREGHFAFPSLPAGVYRIIAHKPGFVPAIQLLNRTAASVYQSLDFDLTRNQDHDTASGEDFWKIRSRIPSDILREVRLAEASAEEWTPPQERFEAEMEALTGFENFGQSGGAALLTGGKIGVRGQLGDARVGIRGQFRDLQSGATRPSPFAGGSTNVLALSVAPSRDARISLTGLRNQLLFQDALGEDGLPQGPRALAPVDLEHYRLAWAGAVGEKGQSNFAAHYTSENHVYDQMGRLELLGVPAASRTLFVGGSFEGRVGRTRSYRTGVSYQERDGGQDPVERGGFSEQRIEAFGVGGWEAQPGARLEYGLYTTLRDGSLSLSPHGGVKVKLGAGWEAEAAVRRRFDQDTGIAVADFVSTRYGDGEDCSSAERHCYKVKVTYQPGESDALSLAAIHREYSDTLQVRFSDDFFAQGESLYLVQGDQVPELQFAVSRRLSEHVVARLRSNVASGGGGVFYAVDESAYQNDVRYLSTSLDTQFQRTSTGVALAFVRLEQELLPLGEGAGNDPAAQVELDRFQILLTQSLDVLANMGRWAVLVDMQLSRGSAPFSLTPPDEVRKRVVGGLAVKF